MWSWGLLLIINRIRFLVYDLNHLNLMPEEFNPFPNFLYTALVVFSFNLAASSLAQDVIKIY